MEKRYVTVENLNEYPFPSKVEATLLANGINNILLAPLVDDGETIGMLELATSTPGKLNPISANRVENVLPMFTAAVKRVKEECLRRCAHSSRKNAHQFIQCPMALF
jgi:hypothetical protein